MDVLRRTLARSSSESRRSITCDTSRGGIIDVYAVGEAYPNLLTMAGRGDLCLRRCPTCERLWAFLGLEPYTSAEYLIKWRGSAEDWQHFFNDQGQKAVKKSN